MGGRDDMICSDVDITRLATSVEVLASEVRRDREERAKQDERQQATSDDHEHRMRALEKNQTRLLVFMSIATAFGAAALALIGRLLYTFMAGA